MRGHTTGIVVAGILAALVFAAWPTVAAEDVLGGGAAPTAPVVGRGLPYYADVSFTPGWDAAKAHRVGRFSLVDQCGRGFNERSLDRRITVVGFFYAACHGICPTSARNLAWLQARTKGMPRVQMATHSVTGDGIDALARFGRAQGVDPARWHLLTGDLAVIDGLMRADYFTWPAGDVPRGRESMHTENLLLIDGQRRIRGIYRGTLRLDVERLLLDIERLDAEEGAVDGRASGGGPPAT